MVKTLEPVEVPADFPDRETLVAIYQFLRGVRNKTDRFDLCGLVEAFNGRTGKNFSVYAFDCAIDIFEELGLLIVNRKRKAFDVPTPKGKLDLMNSRTFRLGRMVAP